MSGNLKIRSFQKKERIVKFFLNLVLTISLTAAALPCLAQRIQPGDLVYQGAFRLPERAAGASNAESWEYGGQALAYCPDGDPGGDADGYPGSLFGTGHDVLNYVSEISIPAPSTSRDLEQLNVATTLQQFHDIRGGLFNSLDEMPRVGLEYLPAQQGQTSAKLYMAWGQHHHDEGEPSDTASHAWCDTDLSNPNTQGAWWVGEQSLYSVNGYLFTIPQQWAEAYTGGAMLATGRYRDGGWSGKGPTIFAIGPWFDGNPPAAGATLTEHTLLLYSHVEDEDDFRLNNYHDSDEWEGGAWVTSGDKAAVVFVGTKGGGDYWWYGYASPGGDGLPCVHVSPDGTMCFNADGTECPSNLTSDCQGPTYKGWWSSRFDAQMMFYDPADFSAVINGTMEPHEPQPYATLDIDEYLLLNATIEPEMLGTGDQRRFRIGEMAYDREGGFLYVLELFADGPQPVVHVWKVTESASSQSPSLNMQKIETNLTSPPVAGASVQITFTPCVQSNLYYRWHSRAGVGSASPGSWQTPANWTMNYNVLTWSPSTDNRYVVLAHVADTMNSTNFHQIGLIFETQGNSTNPIQITGMTTTITYPQSSGTPITLSSTATGGSGQIYYKYFYRLGTAGAWNELGPWSPNGNATWTPRQDGFYTLVLHVSNDNSVPSNSLNQAGMTCSIGQ